MDLGSDAGANRLRDGPFCHSVSAVSDVTTSTQIVGCCGQQCRLWAGLMGAVLNGPVLARQFQQPHQIGLSRGQAGDDPDRLPKLTFGRVSVNSFITSVSICLPAHVVRYGP